MTPYPVREDLGDEHPDHRPLAERVSGDEHQQPGENQHRGGGVVVAGVREQDASQEGEADQVADRANDHQPSPADLIDHGEGRHGGDQVHEPDGHAHPQRRVTGRAGALHHLRRVVQDRVDPRQLVECRDGDGQQDHLAVLRGEERHTRRRSPRPRARRGSPLGSCDSQGAVKYPLNDLVASPTGAAEATTVIQNVDQAPPASGWYINVHLGSSSQIEQNGQPTLYFQPIICGNIGK